MTRRFVPIKTENVEAWLDKDTAHTLSKRQAKSSTEAVHYKLGWLLSWVSVAARTPRDWANFRQELVNSYRAQEKAAMKQTVMEGGAR